MRQNFSVTPGDDYTKVGALCIPLQGNLEDISGVFIFCEKTFLGGNFLSNRVFPLLSLIFFFFLEVQIHRPSMRSNKQIQTRELFRMHHHHPRHHHLFGNILLCPKVLVCYHPLLPTSFTPNCSFPHSHYTHRD